MADMKTNKKTILVTDNSESVVYLIKKYLESKGYNVMAAFNGEEALNTLKDSADIIDLVILDVMMPKVPGDVVLIKMRENPRTKNIPVIICSILNNIESKFKSIDPRVVCMTKPFKMEEMLSKIKMLLERN